MPPSSYTSSSCFTFILSFMSSLKIEATRRKFVGTLSRGQTCKMSQFFPPPFPGCFPHFQSILEHYKVEKFKHRKSICLSPSARTIERVSLKPNGNSARHSSSRKTAKVSLGFFYILLDIVIAICGETFAPEASRRRTLIIYFAND